MFQPKQFYRDLEELLHERPQDSLSQSWFRWLLDEIVSRFGQELLIENGRLYDEDDGEFSLVYAVRARDPGSVGIAISKTYRPLQLILEHKVFVFDTTVEGQSEELEGRLGGLESAAIHVESTPARILAFGLRPGWQRDDLDFALHTLRNAINLRVTMEGFRTDIEQAAEIQRSLLPRTPPEFPGFSLAARSIPAERVGGDFYDFLGPNAGTMVIAVGDASGHGLGAALMARDTVTGIRMGAERLLKITEIIRRLNQVIGMSALSSRFVSLYYADLDSSGDVFYVNAGHPPAWLVGAKTVRRLDVGGTILGPIKDQTFRRGWAHLDPGDSLVIVTDGLIERENSAGAMFGEEGIDAVVRKLGGRPAPEILDAIFTAAKNYGGTMAWQDDTTAVVVTRDPL